MYYLLELLLLVIVFLLLIFIYFLYKKADSLENQLLDLFSSKISQSVKYGKLTEQWIPFSKDFPFSSEQFHFIGNPIDGIVFCDDRIVFCEFKTASSKLSKKQKSIKDLIEDKKVEWLEFKIN